MGQCRTLLPRRARSSPLLLRFNALPSPRPFSSPSLARSGLAAPAVFLSHPVRSVGRASLLRSLPPRARGRRLPLHPVQKPALFGRVYAGLLRTVYACDPSYWFPLASPAALYPLPRVAAPHVLPTVHYRAPPASNFRLSARCRDPFPGAAPGEAPNRRSLLPLVQTHPCAPPFFTSPKSDSFSCCG